MQPVTMRYEHGSIPLALLAIIVIGGLITVLFSAVLTTEGHTRFDRAFSESVHEADAGMNDAYFWLQQQAVDLDIGDGMSGTSTDGDLEFRWEITRNSALEYEVRSTGVTEGEERTVVATVVEDALFFPGAFAESVVNLSGSSSSIDSYESATPEGSCPAGDPDLCWGTDPDFGTGNGAAGTNGIFDFSGTRQVKHAYLYNWDEFKGEDPTAELPGGHRCDDDHTDSPCRADKLRIISDELDYTSEAAMGFINRKLEKCEDEGRMEGKLTIEEGDTLAPHPASNDADAESPHDDGWNSYYCFESLEILDDLVLDGASMAEPVVIFLKDGVRVPSPNTNVNCPGCSRNSPRDVRPEAGSLQIYSAADIEQGGEMVTIRNNTVWAGTIFAPRTECGSENSNANTHVYGMFICREMNNVGNWDFHFDDVLGQFGRAVFSVTEWREELEPVPPAP